MEKADSMSLQEIFEELDTSSNGLSSEEALNRIKTHGFNKLSEKKQASIFYKFIIHAKDLFGMLLLFASLLAFISGNSELSIVILGVVLLNILFSMFQEARAEKAIQTLKHWMPEYAKVLRDGELTKIFVKEIVPGDIIILEEGDRVPADARLIEVFDLWTNNVPLTGESEPQPRSLEPSETLETAYIHSTNLVFMSTSVAKGQGKAVVINTGMNTQFGKIASLTQAVREESSPLHKEIERMAKIDLVLALIVAVVFFLISLLWLNVDFATSILFMIGIMICFVPEGLQVTVSSALAINVLKMVKENVLVKRLSAVQTLGSVTVICTDKTGTITKGEMTVKKLWINNQVVQVSGIGYNPMGEFTIEGKQLKKTDVEATEQLLEISALCNGSKIDPPSDTNKSWTVIGDPTDGALMVAALKFDLNVKEILVEKPIINVIPFDFAKKKMTTIHKVDDDVYVYTKGAPRTILSICNRIYINGKTANLTRENLCLAEEKIKEFAQEGLRVIAVAYKNVPSHNYSKTTNIENDMVFVGLAAMMDPPRLEVRDAVIKARQAGIKTVIITGDYGPTAKFIAQEVGILTREASTIIRGVDLDTLDDRAINDVVKTGNVIFARVSPEQKLRVVKVLKKNGQVVAVTGDGANDAPSLKEADVGIAMGVSGTDVAREAADIVLLDDSFESIVKAVESGRVIYENIRKFIVYVFSHNWAEFVPFLLYATIGIPLPLLVVQILVIDLGIDVIPSLALSREPPELGIMDEPPRSIKERLFTASVMGRSIYIGIVIAIVAMYGCLSVWSAGGWSLGMPLSSDDPIYIKGTTMVFAAIVVGQVGNVLTCRTNKQSIFKTSLRSNIWILLSIITQLIILLVLIYVPPLQSIFGTTALNITDWTYLAMVPIVVIIAEEMRKFVSRNISQKAVNSMYDH